MDWCELKEDKIHQLQQEKQQLGLGTKLKKLRREIRETKTANNEQVKQHCDSYLAAL